MEPVVIDPQKQIDELAKMQSSTSKIAASLAKCQGEIDPPKKDKKAYNYWYTDLAGIISVIKEPMSNNGLSYTQSPTCTATSVTVKTNIFHTSGELISSTLTFPAKITNPQEAGSAITYARRYALSAILGIAAEDDDGEKVSQARPKAQPKISAKKKTDDWKKNLKDELIRRNIAQSRWKEIADKLKDKEKLSDLNQAINASETEVFTGGKMPSMTVGPY